MNEYQILLIIVALTDYIFTILNLHKYRKLFPEKDFTKLEINPLYRYLISKEKFMPSIRLAFPAFISFCLVALIIKFADIPTTCIIIGLYLMVIFYHISNFLELKQEENKRKGKKKSNKTRKVFFIILVVLSFLDILTTGYYISTYKDWQPFRPYSDMEQNPLLLFLWNHLGLTYGIIIGTIIIWSLLYLVAFKTSGAWGWVIIILICLALTFGIINNILNINSLQELIRLYPTGYK